MTLTDPTLTFAIPSLYDSTSLDCRIYLPKRLTTLSHIYPPTSKAPHSDSSSTLSASSATSARTQPTPRLRGAVIAHPYGPLGGCSDDPVVQSIASALLEDNWVVGIFNFRGSGLSGGRTSWSGRPELADYESFVACFVTYLRHVRIPGDDDGGDDLNLLLAGYSYGALLTSHLPPTPTILFRLSPTYNPAFSPSISRQPLSAASEIHQRAVAFALQTSTELEEEYDILSTLNDDHQKDDGSSPVLHDHCIAMGNDSAQSPRRSRSHIRSTAKDNVRRSMDQLRRSLDVQRRLNSPRSKKRAAATGTRISTGPRRPSEQSQSSRPGTGIATATSNPAKSSLLQELPVRTSYLLVSPILPPVSLIATLSLGSRGSSSSPHPRAFLSADNTLAIFGDGDGFASVRRLRSWGACMRKISDARNAGAGVEVGEKGDGEEREAVKDRQKEEGGKGESGFAVEEIKGAGHFWVEEGVLDALRSHVRRWAAAAAAAQRVGKGDFASTNDNV